MHSRNVFQNLFPAVIALLLLNVGLALPAVAEGLGPDHIAKLRSVTSAKISPYGEHIAFTLSVPRVVGEEKDGGAWGELHLN